MAMINYLEFLGVAEVTENNGENEEAKKKKKKKRKPKDKGGIKQQTDPPSIPVSELFPDGNFPVGQVMIHGSAGIDDRMAKMRFTSEEARALDRMHNDIYNEARQAAEAHRQTRKHIMKWVCKPMCCCEMQESFQCSNMNYIKLHKILD